MTIRVKRAAKYGYCAGVRAADLKVRRFAAAGGQAAMLGEVVHNERVVAEMEAIGLRVVTSLDEVREPAVVFSAHGVPPSYFRRATELGLEVLDTTCTFVTDVHNEIRAAVDAGCHVVVIGDPTHREVIGYTHDLDPRKFHVVTTCDEVSQIDWTSYPEIRIFLQTTLDAGAYEEVVRLIEASSRHIRRADTICYATVENQDAARDLARDPEVDIVLVIGGRHSANTRHLWEITARYKAAYLIQGPDDVRPEWFDYIDCVGITAGASTPDSLVDEVHALIESL